jgi:hypothetical protein
MYLADVLRVIAIQAIAMNGFKAMQKHAIG